MKIETKNLVWQLQLYTDNIKKEAANMLANENIQKIKQEVNK